MELNIGREVEFDSDLLVGEFSFNPALYEWHGKTVLCYRRGRDRYSQLVVSELGEALRPGSCRTLEVNCPSPFSSMEDPRFFVFRHELWLSFTYSGPQGVDPSVGIGPVDLQTPSCGDRPVRLRGQIGPEKNWIFFEHDETLFCQYRLNPSSVAAVVGDEIRLLWEGRGISEWRYGEPRGGTNFVRIDDSFMISFFHSCTCRGTRRRREIRYYFGACVLERSFPFRILGYTREPIGIGVTKERIGKHDKCVVYPCGAILREKDLLVSLGHNDRMVRIVRLSLRDVLAAIR